MTLRESIDEFLACKRIAMIGVSRDSRNFSRQLFRTMQSRGYEMIPVNPYANDIEGLTSYGHVQDVPLGVDGALVMTPAKDAESVVEDCIGAGVERIWFYSASGRGAASTEALTLCQEQGLQTIPGECPYMFLPNTGFPHSLHRWIRFTCSSKYNA